MEELLEQMIESIKVEIRAIKNNLVSPSVDLDLLYEVTEYKEQRLKLTKEEIVGIWKAALLEAREIQKDDEISDEDFMQGVVGYDNRRSC